MDHIVSGLSSVMTGQKHPDQDERGRFLHKLSDLSTLVWLNMSRVVWFCCIEMRVANFLCCLARIHAVNYAYSDHLAAISTSTSTWFLCQRVKALCLLRCACAERGSQLRIR